MSSVPQQPPGTTGDKSNTSTDQAKGYEAIVNRNRADAFLESSEKGKAGKEENPIGRKRANAKGELEKVEPQVRRGRNEYNPHGPPKVDADTLKAAAEGNAKRDQTQQAEASNPAKAAATVAKPTNEPKYKEILRGRPYVIKTAKWTATGAVEGENILSQTLDSKVFKPGWDYAGELTLAGLRKLVPGMSSLAQFHKFCTPSGILVSDEQVTFEQYLALEPETTEPTAAPTVTEAGATADKPITRVPPSSAVKSVTVHYRNPNADKVPVSLPGPPQPLDLKLNEPQNVTKAATYVLPELQTRINEQGYLVTSNKESISAGQLTEKQWEVVLRNCSVFFGWIVDPRSHQIRRAPKAAFQLRTKDYRIQGFVPDFVKPPAPPAAPVASGSAASAATAPATGTGTSSTTGTSTAPAAPNTEAGKLPASGTTATAPVASSTTTPVPPTTKAISSSTQTTEPTPVSGSRSGSVTTPNSVKIPENGSKANGAIPEKGEAGPNASKVPESATKQDQIVTPQKGTEKSSVADKAAASLLPSSNTAARNTMLDVLERNTAEADRIEREANERAEAEARELARQEEEERKAQELQAKKDAEAEARAQAQAQAQAKADTKAETTANSNNATLTKPPPLVVTEKGDKGIPNFRVNDDSKIDITVCTHSLMESFAHNDFSSQSTEASVSGGYGGITAGVSAGFAKSESSEKTSERTTQTQTMVARYKYPRCDVFLYPGDLEPTPDFAALLKDIELTKNINALRRVHREYGQLFCQEVTLGGRLLSTKILKADTAADTEAKKEQFKVSVGVQVNTPYGGASVKHEQEKGSGDSKARTETNTMENNVFEAVGGDTILSNNPPLWAASVANPNMWRVIERDGLCSLIEMLSQMTGFKKVQTWFVQAVPALAQFITLDAGHEVLTRLRVMSPTNELSLVNKGNVAYYLSHSADQVVTPRLNLVSVHEQLFWTRIDNEVSRVLFNPSTYRAPVIQGFGDYDVGGSGYGAAYNRQFSQVQWNIAAPFAEALVHGTRVIMKTLPWKNPEKPQVGGYDNSDPLAHMVVFRNAQGHFLPGMSDRDEFQYWRILKAEGGEPGEHIKAGDLVRLCWSFSDQVTGWRDYQEDVFGRRQTVRPADSPGDVLYLKVPWPRFEKKGIPTAMVLSYQQETTPVLEDWQPLTGKTTYCLQDLTFRIDTVEGNGRGDADDYLLRSVPQGQDINENKVTVTMPFVAPRPQLPSFVNDIFFFGIPGLGKLF